MALFGRSDSPEQIVRKLAGRQWQGHTEKQEMLDALQAAGPVRADALVHILGAADGEITRFVVERLKACREPQAAELLIHAMTRAPQGKRRPYSEALRVVPAADIARVVLPMARDADARKRVVALELLGGTSSWHDHLDIIKQLLRDPDDNVRARAVWLLGQGANVEKVRPFLIDLLQNPDDVVRHGAIEALARAPDLEVVEEFFDRLPDEPPRIQTVMIQGVTALVRSGGASADRVLEQLLPLLAADDDGIRDTAACLLGSMPDTTAVLRRFLQYANGIAFWLRDRSFKAVAQAKAQLTGPMLELLEDDDLSVVSGVVIMAGESGNEGLIDGLVKLIERPRLDWWIRMTAVETLHKFRDARVAPVLRRCLEDPEMLNCALACLSERQDPDTASSVMEYLKSDLRGLRIAALHAVRRYEDPRFIPHVERLALADLDDEVHGLALEVLDEYGSEGVAAAASARETRRREQAGALGEVELAMEREKD